MALDNKGEYALLAGRRCLALLDVENPSSIIKRVPRQSKFEVAKAEFNPTGHYAHMCAIISNQRTEVLSWKQSELTMLNTLRSHTRAVSDLHWHCSEPSWLATCSVDTFINIWDIRDPRKPSISLSAVVGATQVRWNRVNDHLLATAHEGDVRLWDTRKGSIPIQYIAAHLHKIHGLDWSVQHDSQLATSSQDHTVKFYDINNPRVVVNALRTICPVWRARYSPFGESMITSSIRRGENGLLLWSLADLTNPVHSFVGHTEVVLEFDWKRSTHDDDYHLITWSKDQSIRIWKVDASLQKLCGHEPETDLNMVEENTLPYKISGVSSTSPKSGKDVETGLEAVEETFLELGGFSTPIILPDTSSRLPSIKSVAASIAAAQAVLSNTLSPSSHRKKNHSVPLKTAAVNSDGGPASDKQSLYSFLDEIEKITLLGGMRSPDSIDIFDIDKLQQSFTSVVRTGKHQVTLHVSLPSGYPNNVAPCFHFGKGTTVDSNGKLKIAKGLKQTATQSTRKGAPCLEAVYQQLICLTDLWAQGEKQEMESPKTMSLALTSSSVTSSSYRLPPNSMGHPNFLPTNALFNSLAHHQDHNIPYPRSSGARFCSAGMLICFGRPSYLKRVSNKTAESSTTPRSLSVNQAYNAGLGLATHSLTVSSSTAPYGLLYPPVAQSPTGDPTVSISSFYNHDRRQKSRQMSKSKTRIPINSSSEADIKRGSCEAIRQHKTVGVVTIYDASGLMPLQQELAEKYVFSDTDVVWMCSQNAAIAAQLGRKDLAHIWSLAALLTVPTSTSEPEHGKDTENPWAQNPFGRRLLHTIIDHYVKQRDIQTVAMICCAFSSMNGNQELARRKARSESGSRNLRWAFKPGDSPYHTIHPGDTLLDSWNVVSGVKQIRSNSWSDSLDDFRNGSSGLNSAINSGTRPLPAVTSIFPLGSTSVSSGFDGGEELKDKDFKLLDPKFNALFDNYRRCYADILYRWGLLEARVLVLKYLSSPLESHRGVDFVTECFPCRQTVRGPQCNLCKRLLLSCSVCRVVVKGSASFCLVCGHGGHALHMAHWFTEETVCPSGCGCICIVENASVLAL